MSEQAAGDRPAPRGEPAPQAEAALSRAPRPGGVLWSLDSLCQTTREAEHQAPQASKRRGAQPGHPEAGRQAFDANPAERIVEVPAEVGTRCPDCDALLEDKGPAQRAVVESHPVKAERVLYRVPKKYCPQCRRTFQPRVPAVLPKRLSGNQLITTATTMHALHGIPLGRVCDPTGLSPGSLMEIFHRLAQLLGQGARPPGHGVPAGPGETCR